MDRYSNGQISLADFKQPVGMNLSVDISYRPCRAHTQEAPFSPGRMRKALQFSGSNRNSRK